MTLETYNKAVNILLDAYNSESLQHESCKACAVGNLLGFESWNQLFVTNAEYDYTLDRLDDHTTAYVQIVNDTGKPRFGFHDNNVYSLEQVVDAIKSKGFTVEELKKIEYAFESALPIKERKYYLYCNKKHGQFLGLEAVLNVMVNMVEEKVDVEIDQKRLKEIYDLKCVAA